MTLINAPVLGARHPVPGLEPFSTVVIAPLAPRDDALAKMDPNTTLPRSSLEINSGRESQKDPAQLSPKLKIQEARAELHISPSSARGSRGNPLHLPEACTDGDALRVDEGGQLRRGGLVRDLRPRQAAAAAHGADLPHLVRVRGRFRVGVRVRVRARVRARARARARVRARARARVRVRVLPHLQLGDARPGGSEAVE
eukprot:scaffold24487_cov41-Phaeocystis_antarctica.AAC.1